MKCSDCVNAYFGSSGIMCGAFNELILFEDTAEDCDQYEENV